MLTSTMLRCAAVLMGAAALNASAQGPEADKARPFAAKPLSEIRQMAGEMPDAVSAAAPASRTSRALRFKPYEGEYALVSAKPMAGQSCAPAVKIECRGDMLSVKGKAGDGYAALVEFDLGLLDVRGGDYKLSCDAQGDSVILSEFTEGGLNEQAIFTEGGLYRRSIPWWGDCVYLRVNS